MATYKKRYCIDGKKVFDTVLCTTKYWFRTENITSVIEDIAILNEAYEENTYKKCKTNRIAAIPMEPLRFNFKYDDKIVVR